MLVLDRLPLPLPLPCLGGRSKAFYSFALSGCLFSLESGIFGQVFGFVLFFAFSAGRALGRDISGEAGPRSDE